MAKNAEEGQGVSSALVEQIHRTGTREGASSHVGRVRGRRFVQEGTAYWIFVLATYEIRASTQYSDARAWVTEEDGKTPAKVGRLFVLMDVEGDNGPFPGESRNSDHADASTRGEYDTMPARVTAVAYAEDPPLGPVFDTSDT